ncbi:MAG: hypothetical protein IKC87_05570 [Clostridia bacterium]|nr:hypothetical protein [Clostridia bacterium]
MTKKQFATLIFCTVAGMIFALGMCMCLLPEWNAFTPGVVMTAIGGVMLLVFGIIALIKNRKNAKPLNWKLIGKISYAIIASLVLGLGMSMIMKFDMLLYGIIVGIVGVVMLLCLIPMFLGFKSAKRKEDEQDESAKENA